MKNKVTFELIIGDSENTLLDFPLYKTHPRNHKFEITPHIVLNFEEKTATTIFRYGTESLNFDADHLHIEKIPENISFEYLEDFFNSYDFRNVTKKNIDEDKFINELHSIERYTICSSYDEYYSLKYQIPNVNSDLKAEVKRLINVAENDFIYFLFEPNEEDLRRYLEDLDENS